MRTRRFRSEAIDQRKGSRTRALLMDAAVTIFAQRGVDAAPISDVTALAKVSNGTFYYHFKDKAELVDAVGHGVAAALVSQVDDAMKDIEDGEHRVALATQLFVKLAVAEPEWGWLVVKSLSDMEQFFNQITSGIRKDVGIGIDQGHFDVELSDVLLTMLLSVVGVAVRQRLEHPDNPNIELLASELILRMLGTPRKRARELPPLVWSKYSSAAEIFKKGNTKLVRLKNK